MGAPFLVPAAWTSLTPAPVTTPIRVCVPRPRAAALWPRRATAGAGRAVLSGAADARPARGVARSTPRASLGGDSAPGGSSGSGDAPLFVVTGGTGFLGDHLVQQLLGRGAQVRMLCRSPLKPAPGEGAPPAVQVVQGSIEDTASLERLFQGEGEEEGAPWPPVAGVFHLAGVVEHSLRRAEALEAANVQGTLNVLRAALGAGVRRVVYASTSGTVAVSAGPSAVASDDSPYADALTRGWPYYASKIRAEKQAREWAREQGMELICMRPTLLLGPGDRRLSSCRTVADLLTGRIPFLPEGGLSFVDVRDTASAFIRAMESAPPGATYLLGAQNLSLPEFFLRVEDASGVPGPRLRVPSRVAWGLAAAASAALGAVGQWSPSLDPVLVEMSQHYWYLDATRAARELGFRPRDPEETIRDTVAWLRAHPEVLQ